MKTIIAGLMAFLTMLGMIFCGPKQQPPTPPTADELRIIEHNAALFIQEMNIYEGEAKVNAELLHSLGVKEIIEIETETLEGGSFIVRITDSDRHFYSFSASTSGTITYIVKGRDYPNGEIIWTVRL